jgi:Uncharacterized alpha/beta hydrolase domain (DUF2235)
LATSEEQSRESRELHTPLQQRAGALNFAAAGTPIGAAGTSRATPAPGGLKLTLANAAATGKTAEALPPVNSCKQCLNLNFFFDGTGNNIDADVGTMQHSNVARLFLGRLEDDEVVGRFSYYVYGLGTYFKEIGDDGNTQRGKGLGHKGQARLDWAFQKFDKAVSDAEKRAENPTNKIVLIKVHVFGFSRGAAAARAFVRDLAVRCELKGAQHVLKQGQHPIEVGFLGLFDTVASVGAPMSANNTPGATTAGWYELPTTLSVRASHSLAGIPRIAFGEPGADPAPGDFDGHMDWADGLVVPDLVKRCVHLTAGHEFRNSFPVDSVLNGRRYPSNTTESVYPGAHSDVGGGYQPGEGARSQKPGEMLSLIPLRVMHAEAKAAGVPLLELGAMASRSQVLKRSFALDEEGSRAFSQVQDHFKHYIANAGSGGRDVGKELLAHMLWFYRWRFFAIKRNQDLAKQGQPARDAGIAASREREFAAERARMRGEVDALRQKWEADQAVMSRAESHLQRAQIAQARSGIPVDPKLRSDAAAARAAEEISKDRHLARKAQLDTFADDSTLGAAMAAYDARLLADAKAIIEHRKKNPSLKIRPHYANLVSAYEDEFVRNRGLRDEKLIAFFDTYVHDSLAGFAQDATLPSDPRVIYIGGDNKMRFAGVLDGGSSASQAA